MKKRLPVFDYIRAIAIIGILTCHFLYNWNCTSQIGRFLGCTFNVVFLCISALLIGTAWHEKGQKPCGWAFLQHRLSRLITSYYPFLVCMFLFLSIVVHYPVRIYDIGMHLAFLPWFDKMPGFGHLWFLTMIALCYGMLTLTSRIKHVRWQMEATVLLAIAVAHYVLLQHGLPGQMLSYLAIFLIIHRHAPSIMRFAYQTKASLMTGAATTTTIICTVAFNQGLYENARFVAEWMGIASAVVILLALIRLLSQVSSHRLVDYTARISFEIYLVHHVMAFGPYATTQWFPHPAMALLSLVVATLLLASVLHWCSLKLSTTIC